MPLKIDDALIQDLIRREERKQAVQPSPPKKDDEGVGLLSKILFASGLGADVATTLAGELSGRTREANPLLKPIRGLPVGVRAPLVAGAEVAGTMLLNKLIGKKHPKIMKAIMMGTGAMHGGAAIKNIGEIKKGKAAMDLASRPMSSSSNTPPAPGMVQTPDGSWINPDYFGGR